MQTNNYRFRKERHLEVSIDNENNIIYKLNAHIVDQLNSDIIIGMENLRQLKSIINLDEDTITLEVKIFHSIEPKRKT